MIIKINKMIIKSKEKKSTYISNIYNQHIYPTYIINIYIQQTFKINTNQENQEKRINQENS